MTTPQAVIERALKDRNYTECFSEGHSHCCQNHTYFGSWYGLNGEPWCAMCVSRWFYDVGLPLKFSTSKGFAFTPAGVAGFQRMGTWHKTDPHPGDCGFLYYPSLGRVGHVFLVMEVRGANVVTIEGNTNGAGSREGGSVLVKQRAISSVYGFGTPLWEGEEDVALSEDDKTWINSAVRAIVKDEIDKKVAASEFNYHQPRYDDLNRDNDAILAALRGIATGDGATAQELIDEFVKRLSRAPAPSDPQ